MGGSTTIERLHRHCPCDYSIDVSWEHLTSFKYSIPGARTLKTEHGSPRVWDQGTAHSEWSGRPCSGWVQEHPKGPGVAGSKVSTEAEPASSAWRGRGREAWREATQASKEPAVPSSVQEL